MGLIRDIVSRVLGRAPTRPAPPNAPLGTVEERHRYYEAMAEEPESETGGPLLAGRLKYLDQIERHGHEG